MAKNKLGFGAYMSIVAGILAIVACVLYRTVMYQYQPVYFMLIGAAVLAVLGLLIGKAIPKLANYIPVVMVFLLFSAIVWGSMLMVNQIGNVVAGLDGIDTIMGFIIFATVSAVGVLMYIIAAFLPQAKAAE